MYNEKGSISVAKPSYEVHVTSPFRLSATCAEITPKRPCRAVDSLAYVIA